MKPTIHLTTEETESCTDLLMRLVAYPSERALIIVAAAHLDALSEEALKTMLPGMDFGFERNLKILVARGLLAEEARELLMAMYRIRCGFAHTPKECWLADERFRSDLSLLHKLDPLLASDVEELSDSSRGLPSTKEMKFIACAAILLSSNLIAAKHLCPKPPEPPRLANFEFRFPA